MEKKEIRYDSPEAAIYKTDIKGWVSADGFYYGKDEHMARWRSCTHVKCESCDNYVSKTWTKCEACRNAASIERYKALPYLEWDRQTPLCIWNDDRYFFSEDDLIEYLEENEMQGNDLMLVLCSAMEYREIDEGYFGCDAHEDWEAPKELAEAIDKLNKIVKELPPHSYTAGKIRTSYDYTPETPIQ